MNNGTYKTLNEMYNPPHPGSILLNVVLPHFRLKKEDAADEIGVTRVTLSRIMHGHSSISPQMALKLERWLRNKGYEGGSAEHWMTIQMQYDLWRLRSNQHLAA